MIEKRIKSVNWHITSKCNYQCRFCYVQKLDDEILDINEAETVLTKLRDTKTETIDVEKINFVGGEPFLHPLFYDLLKMAHDMGFTISITTNGSLINEENIGKIAQYADWVGISVDSISNMKEAKLGRGMGKHVSHAIGLTDLIHEHGLKLKINTTVTRLTYQENMHSLIHRMNPHRWKVFQMLPIKGQNDSCVKELAISEDEFKNFVERHKHIRLIRGEKPVFEYNDDMIGSYFMVSPSGKITSNNNMEYETFEFEEFLEQQNLVLNPNKYIKRRGLYDWKR